MTSMSSSLLLSSSLVVESVAGRELGNLHAIVIIINIIISSILRGRKRVVSIRPLSSIFSLFVYIVTSSLLLVNLNNSSLIIIVVGSEVEREEESRKITLIMCFYSSHLKKFILIFITILLIVNDIPSASTASNLVVSYKVCCQ